MKRFFIILSALFFSITGFAQKVEMFSLEREIDVPIIPTRVLYERAYEWLRTIDSVPAKVYDDQLHPIGHRADWVRRRCNLRYRGKDYLTKYTFSLSIVPTGDGKCTVRLYRPLVSAYCGRRTILTVDDLPIVYGGYNKGMFGATRNKEARIFVCDEVKRLLTEEFETMIPSITEALEGRVASWEFVQV